MMRAKRIEKPGIGVKTFLSMFTLTPDIVEALLTAMRLLPDPGDAANSAHPQLHEKRTTGGITPTGGKNLNPSCTFALGESQVWGVLFRWIQNPKPSLILI